MDTFVECGLTHTLTSGQTVSLEAERDPRVTHDLPSTCELTFETSSEDEFEQVCIEMEVLTSQMGVFPGEESDDVVKATEKHLEIQGINTRFYSSNEVKLLWHHIYICPSLFSNNYHINTTGRCYSMCRSIMIL